MGFGPGEPGWLWLGEVLSEFREDDCVRWQIFSVAICIFGSMGALWWFGHLPWDGTGVFLPRGNQNLHIQDNFFLATCGTWYQSNTCWFFVHFSCGFSNVVALLLWSGLSTLVFSCELCDFNSSVSKDFTNAMVNSSANCCLLSDSLDQYLK